jgi:hypothetical protein
MPSLEQSKNEEPILQMSPELANRLVDALEKLANGHGGNNNANGGWPPDALFALIDRMGDSRTGPQLTTAQRRLALRYDALRTALGRKGAASIVYGVPGQDSISIRGTNVPGIPLTFYGYTADGNEVSLAPPPVLIDDRDGLRHVVIKDLASKYIVRFELRNQADYPILFGLITPAPASR